MNMQDGYISSFSSLLKNNYVQHEFVPRLVSFVFNIMTISLRPTEKKNTKRGSNVRIHILTVHIFEFILQCENNNGMQRFNTPQYMKIMPI